jgi:two-component system OmpR family sensor kinase/two-component system sensor histidine kinase QseC
MSIRARLLWSLLAMLALAAALMGVVTYRNVLGETEALFDYQLRQMALSLRDQGEIAPDQASALADEQLDFVVQIWTVDGRSIYASRLHPELPARALLGFADVAAGGRTWRTFSVATRDRVIQVAQPVQIRRQLAADAALRSVAPLALVAPLMLLLAGWVATRSLAPLRRLAGELRGRDAQTLSALPTAGLPDEAAPLVNALNALLARLGAARDTQRAFVADAAHELRSPLTALKLQLQLLRRAPDDATRSEATDALTGGIERAARLVEQLLALARSEPGAAAAAVEDLDLAELARQAVADVVPLAASCGTELRLEADAAVPVRGDRPALAALVRNLADNAVRYAPRGAKVELRVARQGERALLRVDDSGPGIPPAERERVFDRFYRRAAGDEPGSGLGLAIVRGVAAQHGGDVSLGDSPLGGLQVVVRMPAAEASSAASG